MSVARMCDRLAAPPNVRAAAERAAAKTQNVRYEPQRTVAVEVLNAFFEQGIADSDLTGTLGYGYDDAARATYEALLARIFGTERALARLSIVSGTHAIVATLAACASSGDGILAVTGRPYDTLRNSICDDSQSLVARGRHYREVELCADGTIDADSIVRALEERNYAVAFVQRSRGYAPRRSVSVDECARAVEAVKRVSPATLVLVDNCYGELVEEREPTHVGADAVMGSLIKNLGGSIAPGGGYIAGSAAIIERVATRIYVPGLGDSLGPTLGFGRAFVHGLFLAPGIVEQCLRGLDFAAALFGQRRDVVVGDDHHLAVVGFVGACDIAVLDDFAVYLAHALVPDAAVVLGMYLVKLDVVVLGRAVHLDRDVDQPERDRALPDRTHSASMPILLGGYAFNDDASASCRLHTRFRPDRPL